MKHSEQIGLVEVSSDGRTVWVNGANGWNVGRFSEAGIDFGDSSRLKAKAGPLTQHDWLGFQFDMLDVHGVRVADTHKPDFLRGQV
jgi:hypothetical protein